jgi:HAD superfamily hydrolase (TIGR01509 family)
LPSAPASGIRQIAPTSDPPVIHAVVFDFDGVLANSEPLHLAAYQEIFRGLKVELSREEYYEQYLGFDDDGVFRYLATTRGWSIDDAWVAALIAQKSVVFDELMARSDVLYPGARDCIEQLASAYPLGIASGALKHEIEAVLDRAALRRHFRFVVASGDTARSKPAPDPYLHAAALHGCDPAACVAIEDSRWGIVSAKAAGLTCIGITTTYKAEELQGADRIITSLKEFTPALIAGL